MRKQFDAILLLGVELNKSDGPTHEMCARVRAAATAYHRGEADVIIACGGVLPGHRIAEARVMRALLEAEGVPREAVLLDRQSRDTMENMRCAASLLGGAKDKRVLVVTSDYHLRRAVLTARRVGFDASGMAATLSHDAAWRALARKELCFTLDLLAGWQDAGRSRPAWTMALFGLVFGQKARQNACKNVAAS